MGSQEATGSDQSHPAAAVNLLTTTEQATSPVLKFDISLQPSQREDTHASDGGGIQCYQPGDRLRADIVLVVLSIILFVYTVVTRNSEQNA